MAAADDVGAAADRQQQCRGPGLPVFDRRDDRPRERQADVARVAAIDVRIAGALLERREDALCLLPAAGGRIRHQRVHVVEDVEAVFRGAGPAVRHLVPAVADVDAAQRHAPHQLGSVHQLEHDIGRLRVDQPVIQIERGLALAELDVVQREVPPVVERQRRLLPVG